MCPFFVLSFSFFLSSPDVFLLSRCCHQIRLSVDWITSSFITQEHPALRFLSPGLTRTNNRTHPTSLGVHTLCTLFLSLSFFFSVFPSLSYTHHTLKHPYSHTLSCSPAHTTHILIHTLSRTRTQTLFLMHACTLFLSGRLKHT